MTDLEAYRKELREVMLTRDTKLFIDFAKRWAGPVKMKALSDILEMPYFEAELSMHRMIATSDLVPKEMKTESIAYVKNYFLKKSFKW